MDLVGGFDFGLVDPVSLVVVGFEAAGLLAVVVVLEVVVEDATGPSLLATVLSWGLVPGLLSGFFPAPAGADGLLVGLLAGLAIGFVVAAEGRVDVLVGVEDCVLVVSLASLPRLRSDLAFTTGAAGLSPVFGALGSGCCVGSADVRVADFCSSSTALSGFKLGSSLTAPAGASTSTSETGPSFISDVFKPGGEQGSGCEESTFGAGSGVSTLLPSVLGSLFVATPSWCLEGLGSWHASRCRPMRPSFSIATKFVRTFDNGRGDSEE